MSITTTPYGFNPALTAGLVLWLDASDTASVIQSGGTISQWIDRSPSSLTATAVNSPTLVANVQNGFPGISFNGSTQYFNLGNNLSMGTNQLYIFVVSKFNSTADGAIIGKSLYGGATGRYSLLRVGGTLNPLIQATGGGNDTGVNSDTSTSARLLNMVWDRSTINLYQNGSSIFSLGFSDSANVTNGFSLLIGAYQNSSGGTPPVAGLYMNGYIHEILMYMTPTGSPLGDTARQQIESYLAQKWGLTLGASHPGLTSTVYRSTYLKNTGAKRNIATMTPFFTGFTPRQIPGLTLWLDGADPAGNGVIPVNGASLATWVDKSGTGQNLTGFGSPTLGTFNGLRIVNFSNSYFQNISFTQSGPLTIIFIGKMNSLGGDWQTFSDNVSGLRPYVGMQPGTPSRTAFRFGGTATTNVEIWTLTFSSSDNTVFNVNGSDVRGAATGYGGIGFTNGIRLGFAGNNSAYLIGWIGEYLVYNTDLSISQYQQVESYLSQKWGLVSSLPAGHLHVTQPAGARTGLSLVNSKFLVTPRPPIVVTFGDFTSIVGGAAGGGLWMTAVTPNGDIYTKSYNPTVYRLRGATYSNPFSCDNWGQGLTTDGTFVYGTDTNSAQIFRFNPATSTRNLMINSIASPCGLAADGIGNIYISQQIWQNPNNTLYRYNIAANTTTTLYNVSLSTYYFAGMAPDGLGNLYLSDYVTNKIYKLNSSNVLSVLAGSGTAGFADGTGAAASFNISMYINFSNNLCYDGNGNLYLAETNNNRIRKIVIATAVVTTIAGTGVSGTVDGPGLTARLAAPLGISYANGFLYWCEDKIVRRLTL